MAIQMTDGLRQLYCPRLNTVSRTADFGIRGWLMQEGNYIATNTSFDNCIELALYDDMPLLYSLAKDIDRLTCAAIETLASVHANAQNAKFLAWQMVQTYYAAFYAAHSTLKVCGMGLTQIDNNILQSVKRRANAQGITLPPLKAGMYCLDWDAHISKVRMYTVTRYDDSHRGLWQRYADFLRLLCGTHIRTNEPNSNCIRIRQDSESRSQSVYSQLPLADAQLLVERLELLSQTLNKKGDENWLSYIRNEINYSHSLGVWHPYARHHEQYTRILDKRDLYMINSLDDGFKQLDDCDLMKFYKGCHLVVSINREIVLDLVARHPKNKSFLKNGSLYLLNTHRLATV